MSGSGEFGEHDRDKPLTGPIDAEAERAKFDEAAAIIFRVSFTPGEINADQKDLGHAKSILVNLDTRVLNRDSDFAERVRQELERCNGLLR